MLCPHCGSGATYRERKNDRLRPRHHKGANLTFRYNRCRGCGLPFATVEAVVGGLVAEAIEHAIGGFHDDEEPV